MTRDMTMCSDWDLAVEQADLRQKYVRTPTEDIAQRLEAILAEQNLRAQRAAIKSARGQPDRRGAALRAYIEKLSPNLIRAYVLDMIQDAGPVEIEKLVVAFKAQNAVQGESR